MHLYVLSFTLTARFFIFFAFRPASSLCIQTIGFKTNSCIDDTTSTLLIQPLLESGYAHV